MKIQYKAIIAGVIAAVVLIAGIRLLFAKTTVIYGIILLGVVIIAFLVWKAFIKNGRDELKRSEKEREKLEDQLAVLRQEMDEMSRSRLNVTGISPILHLSVLQIDTSFTRSYVRTNKDKTLSFNGALRVDICAEYGIRMEDVLYNFDQASGTLYLRNFNPGLISFSKKQLNWDIARSYHRRDLLGLFELAPAVDDEAMAFTRKMTDELRAEIEKEIDERKIAEFEWLNPVISRQVTDAIRLAIGHPEAKVVVLDTQEGSSSLPASEGFVAFDTLVRTLAAPSPEES